MGVHIESLAQSCNHLQPPAPVGDCKMTGFKVKHTRWDLKLAIILFAILVLNNNYFLLFTFAHCDHVHQVKQSDKSGPVFKSFELKQNPAKQSSLSVQSQSELTATSMNTTAHRDNHAADVGESIQSLSRNDQIVKTTSKKIERVDATINNKPDSLVGGERFQNGQASSSSRKSALGQPVSRTKRMVAARSRAPRVQLAQRPPKATTTSTTSTTTTTTTSTTTTTTAASTSSQDAQDEPGEKEGEEAESESIDSDDYVDIKPTTSTMKTTTEAEVAADGEGSEEEEDEESEQPTTTSTTTTTTTTRKPTTRKSSRKSRIKSKVNDEQTTKKPATKTSKTSAKIVQDEKSEFEPTKKEQNETEQVKLVNNETEPVMTKHHIKKKPLVLLPFIRPKNISVCTPEAYLEFPRDFIGDKWRSRGLIIIHVLIVCYMFYSLALVCERYFMPSLEEFAQRLQISEDVAGATLMSAGSSAPELFTAILGVFVAKGDVGTGAIVGSAVFNILFVIGVCAFVSSTSAQLQWWPVLRDSIYYTFAVLMLIIIIYDERITALESGMMILLYGVYIAIMVYNEQIKAYVTVQLLSYPLTAKLISTSSIQVDGPDDVFGGLGNSTSFASRQQYEMGSVKTVEDDSIFMAALLVIIKHKRLFRSTIRFQSAARYIIIKRQHRMQQQRTTTQEVNYFGPEDTTTGRQQMNSSMSTSAQRAKMEAYARSTTLSKQKFSIVSKDDYEFWHRPPEEGENYFLWLARIPVNYLLHYTIPDCTLYPDKYIVTFVVSIIWTALFSYLMVWMVTLIGYTLGIPDSVMGVTFLAAGTSVPDCYSSIHAARNGMADMAVSNSIGSNVFDILIGLSVPWFIQSAVYPGVVATINSRGVIYSVILLFLSLIVTIYLLNKYDWSLQPRLGLALLIAYGLFIILTCMLEFNLLGHVNPPPCPPPIGGS